MVPYRTGSNDVIFSDYYYGSSGTVSSPCPPSWPYLVGVWVYGLYGGAAWIVTSAQALSTGVSCNSGTCTNSLPTMPTNEGAGGGNPSEKLKTTCACDPVDPRTGMFYETQTDFDIPARGPDLGLSRTYNVAQRTANGPFGYGWTFDAGMHMIVDPVASGPLSSAGVVDVVQENGSYAQFTKNGSSYGHQGRLLADLSYNSTTGVFTFTRGRTESYTFDSQGRLLSHSDLNGYTESFTYTGGTLTSVTDSAGRSLTFAYTGGLITSVTDPAGRQTSYTYDGAGNLATATDPAGKTWSFGYDSLHRMTSITDPRGHATTNVFDSRDRVTSQTDRANRTSTITYDTPPAPFFIGGWTVHPATQLVTPSAQTTVTDPRGNKTRFLYDDTGYLVRETRGLGTARQSVTTYLPDLTSGVVTAVEDGNGNRTGYSYDQYGNLTGTTDPLGHTTSATYNSLNEPLTVTDATNVTTTYSYDSNGNLQSASRPLTGSSPAVSQTVSYSYGDTSHPGDVTAITDPRGKTTSLVYDSYGQLTSSTDPNGDTYTYTYTCTPAGPGCRSNIGWIYTTVSPRGNAPGATAADFTTSVSRDDDGRVTATTDPLGHSTSSSYDDNGNLVSSTDENNRTTGYSYDNDDELTTVTRADTTTEQTGYDAAGNVTSHTDGATHTTSYTYDELNRLGSVTDPNTRTTSYGYDAGGRLTAITDPASKVTSFGYDAANRRTSISYSDAVTPNVSYGYDNGNRRTSMTDGTGTTSYSYDSLGRLTSTTNGAGKTVGYDYDLAGNVTGLTYPNSQTVTRGYDDAGRLTSVTDWNANTSSFGYDEDGNLTGITYPNGISETTTVNRAGEVTAVTDALSSTTVASYSYGRDPLGLLTSTTPTGPTGQTSEAYGHSSLNQLTSYTTSTTSGSYGYDSADNLTTLPDGTTQAFDAANQLTGISGGPAGTINYGYNSRGDRTSATTSAGTTSYGYDQANRLTSYTPVSGTSASYSYDGDGLRASKTVGTTTSTFTWDSVSDELPMLLADGSVKYVYGPGGLPIEQIDATGTTYLQHDGHGSTRLISDSTGSVTGTYTYDPYGNSTSHTGTAGTQLRYDGQYQDDETGFYYLRARYYDPSTAQFLTRDPFEAITGSPYGYAGGDPLDRSDPSGLCWGPDSLCDYLTQAGESWTATVDTVTGGATRWVRHKLGIDDSYTTTSDAYQATVNLWLGPSCIDGVPVTRGEIPFMPGEVPASVERNLFELPASARTTMNEQYMFQRLSTYNGISPETASARLHAIKAENSLGGADNVVFDMSGNVFNPKTGDYLGSLTQGGR